MPTLLSFSENQLVSELWARDIRFLMGAKSNAAPMLDSAHLIAALAESADARIRLALIPLFLRHPEFSAEVRKAEEWNFSPNARLTMRFYYTAAVLLQNKYQERLYNIFGKQTVLPDIFSGALGLSFIQDPDKDLTQLAQRHQTLSGQTINWLGTYEHAAVRLIKHMEKFK